MRKRIRLILFLVCIILLEAIFINYIHDRMKKSILTAEAENKKTTEIQKKIVKDLKCFPISIQYKENIQFEDSFGAYRENGGHAGCDLMYDENTPGVVPVISATDGTITNLGWLYLGGYRVGITSDNGIYYYYAHFDSCASGLYVGKPIRAGEFLGFMGNTGEGEEGTEGKFPVHLHFGIYIKDEKGNEETVNPYQYLMKINED